MSNEPGLAAMLERHIAEATLPPERQLGQVVSLRRRRALKVLGELVLLVVLFLGTLTLTGITVARLEGHAHAGCAAKQP